MTTANPDSNHHGIASELKRQYEVLREQTLNPDQPSNGLGLSVFIRKGMAAWINALTNHFLSTTICPIHSNSTKDILTDTSRREWILALAALVLGDPYAESDCELNLVGGVS